MLRAKLVIRYEDDCGFDSNSSVECGNVRNEPRYNAICYEDDCGSGKK